ncbi:hypothetical protein HD553DRAFT_308372 [Filobasidium floriforme]|uniref:uncharacterized protein n=1 Tax=Filobasidium floriforme TaxID=5210 RepID=UPI001E8DAE92|nr:uncharacterized protein HD553DRAFT_308372 [Filobasidium floriforme]KAH8087527.1 hypothetical protein HD553DRAFT_308372 [Filobasidium floriforme]
MNGSSGQTYRGRIPPFPSMMPRSCLNTKTLEVIWGTPSNIWKYFPHDLFDSLFAQCDVQTLKDCRLLSRSVSDVAAKHLFSIVSCCDSDMFDRDDLMLDRRSRIVSSRFGKHIRCIYCDMRSGSSCLRAWELGHPHSNHIKTFILRDFGPHTGGYAYLQISKPQQEESRSVYTSGKYMSCNMHQIVCEVYLSSGNLVCKQLESTSPVTVTYVVSDIILRRMIEPHVNGIDGLSTLERIDIPAWTIDDLTEVDVNGKNIFPQIHPHLTYLGISDPDRYAELPSIPLWCLSQPSLLRHLDHYDRHRIRDLRILLLSLPSMVELNLREYEPFWWPVLTWTTDRRFPTLFRGPIQVLHIAVDFDYLEQASQWWGTEIYRDDMGADGSGTLKRLYLYVRDYEMIRRNDHKKPLDPALILKWVERTVPRGCRVYFRLKYPGGIAATQCAELEEAFNETFPRGWRHVEPSATSSDAVL